MQTRKLAASLALATFLISGGVAASTFTAIDAASRQKEQVVEGHTVFEVVEKGRQAFAVAGLVREQQRRVLWFNDQLLVGSDDRYPCGGWVTAAPTGRVIGGTYTESYRVTDPNDFVWIVDYYSPGWIVSVLNSLMNDNGIDACQPVVDAPEGPTGQYASIEGAQNGYLDPGLNGHCYSGGQAWDDSTERCGPSTDTCPGINSPYPDTRDFDGDGRFAPPGSRTPVSTVPKSGAPACDWPRVYNFVIVGFWNAANWVPHAAGTKAYGCSDRDRDGDRECKVGNADFGKDNADKNGCQERRYSPHNIQWDCIDRHNDPSKTPDRDVHTASDPADHNEGNSHAYNPTLCDSNGDGELASPPDTPCWSDYHTHAAAGLDLRFQSHRPGIGQIPAGGRRFVIDDSVGREAPFHDNGHSKIGPPCDPGWGNPGNGSSDPPSDPVGYGGASPYC